MSYENNLIDIIEGRSHVGETFLSGVATNQSENNKNNAIIGPYKKAIEEK